MKAAFLKIARVTIWRMAWYCSLKSGRTRESVRTHTGHWQWRWKERSCGEQTDRQTAGLGDQMVGGRQRKVKDDDIMHTKDSANRKTTNRYKATGKESSWGGRG